MNEPLLDSTQSDTICRTAERMGEQENSSNPGLGWKGWKTGHYFLLTKARYLAIEDTRDGLWTK